MKNIKLNIILFLFISLLFSCTAMTDSQVVVDYDVVTCGTREYVSKDGSFSSKILLEAANLGGDEVQVAEMIFPAGHTGKPHPHASIEVFYVLEGVFGHVVNGKGRMLNKGELGIVRPGDSVVHSTPDDSTARVLIIWVPGGEIPPLKENEKSPWKTISCPSPTP